MNAPNISPLRWLAIALLGGAFAISIVALAAATGWDAVWTAISRLTGGQIALLLLLSLANYVLRGGRWHLLCRALDIPSSLSTSMRHYVGGFAMTVTPGRLGELIRLRWILRETGRRPDSTAALVIADRAADLSCVGLLLAFMVTFSATGLDGAWVVATLSLGLAFAATRPSLFRFGLTQAYRMLGILPRIFAGLRRASAGLAHFSKVPVLLPMVILSVSGWLAEALAFWLLLGWMGAEIALPVACAIFFFSMLTGGASGMPGGIGGAEAAMVAALVLAGVPLEIALPATAVIRITTLWFAIAVGLAVFPFAERTARHAVLREA